MTAEEQNAAIRAAFANEDTLPKEKDLLDAIGKIPSLVEPRKEALLHVAAALIDVYSQDGCPVDCGPDWTPEHIEAAICRGVHPSADSKEALEALHAETDKKVKNRYSKVLRYGDIKGLYKKLKISPVAMIPHKSRAYRTILDLALVSPKTPWETHAVSQLCHHQASLGRIYAGPAGPMCATNHSSLS